jgi:hypothetical protein
VFIVNSGNLWVIAVAAIKASGIWRLWLFE